MFQGKFLSQSQFSFRDDLRASERNAIYLHTHPNLLTPLLPLLLVLTSKQHSTFGSMHFVVRWLFISTFSKASSASLSETIMSDASDADAQSPKRTVFPCEHCDLVFMLAIDRQHHVKDVHSDSRKHRCEKCGRLFYVALIRDRHLESCEAKLLLASKLHKLSQSKSIPQLPVLKCRDCQTSSSPTCVLHRDMKTIEKTTDVEATPKKTSHARPSVMDIATLIAKKPKTIPRNKLQTAASQAHQSPKAEVRSNGSGAPVRSIPTSTKMPQTSFPGQKHQE